MKKLKINFNETFKKYLYSNLNFETEKDFFAYLKKNNVNLKKFKTKICYRTNVESINCK